MKNHNLIRLVAHGQAWFSSGHEVLSLMKLQCSATRSAYQAIHKDGLSGNDAKKSVKSDYMSSLNQRYIADACSVAQGLAKEKNKPLVVEKLNFKKQKTGFKKFRRMKHNFLHRKIIEAIKSRALKENIPLVDVNPAFTSKLGHLKFQNMFSIPIHDAAAMVIARRAMGIQERQTFVVKKADKPNKDGKIPWNLEGRHGSCMLSEKAWSWLENCFLKPKSSSLTGTRLDVGSRPTIERSVVRTTGESIPTTGRDGCVNASGEERLPCKSGDVRLLQIC